MGPIRYFKPEQLKEMTAGRRQEFSVLFSKLRKRKPKNLDEFVHRLHEEAFSQFDCLGCANCCLSISPIVTVKDAERLAKGLKQKVPGFVDRYLYTDGDGDMVFKETPCPFLLHDKYCCVYENRPRACREYPHTDRARFYQILNLTLKNCEICPVVYAITSELSSHVDEIL